MKLKNAKITSSLASNESNLHIKNVYAGYFVKGVYFTESPWVNLTDKIEAKIKPTIVDSISNITDTISDKFTKEDDKDLVNLSDIVISNFHYNDSPSDIIHNTLYNITDKISFNGSNELISNDIYFNEALNITSQNYVEPNYFASNYVTGIFIRLSNMFAVGEILNVTENLITAYNKNFTDNLVYVTDTGTYLLQDYANSNYFASTYVGSSGSI